MRHLLLRITLSLTISLSLTFATTVLADVDEHIVLWLQFDEGAGDVTLDSSNYGNDGTIVGPKWAEGKYGSALLFDGIDDYVEVTSNDTLQLSEEGLTLAAWFKTEETAGHDLMIIEKGAWDAGEYALSYPGYVNRRVRFQINQIYGQETEQIDSTSGVPELSDNEWHHAAGVYDAVEHTFKVYVDGVLEEEQGARAHVFTPDDQSVYVGTRNNQTLYFRGVIDELLVADVPFTAEQLERHMEGSLVPVYPAGSLVTVWGKLKNTSQ
jgi:hypothetical protein